MAGRFDCYPYLLRRLDQPGRIPLLASFVGIILNVFAQGLDLCNRVALRRLSGRTDDHGSGHGKRRDRPQ